VGKADVERTCVRFLNGHTYCIHLAFIFHSSFRTNSTKELVSDTKVRIDFRLLIL